MTSKLHRYYSNIPSIYNPTVNKMVNGLIEAWAEADENIVTQLSETKNQLFVETAENQYLDALGNNVDINRPLYIALSDIYFRDLIEKMSYAPKQVRQTFYDVLDIFWGPTYSRANFINEASENYNFGSVAGITGQITFTNNSAIVSGVGTFFTSELSVGDYIRLTENNNEYFVRVNNIVSDTKLYLDTAYLNATNTSTAKKITPKTLIVKIDNDVNTTTLYLNPKFFPNLSSITAAEIASAINNESDRITAESVQWTVPPYPSYTFINLRTNTPGLCGKIQVTGGTANSLLTFYTTVNTVYDLVRSTLIYEINPREMIVAIPNLVARIERSLYGATHIHYDITGIVLNVDNIAKTILVNLSESVTVDELIGKTFTQNIYEYIITGNTAGQSSVTISLNAGSDLNFIQGDGAQSFNYGPTTQTTLTHNLNQIRANVQLYNSDDEIFLSSVTGTGVNTTQLDFATSQIGKAVIATQNNVFPQATPATSWSINHALSSQYLNCIIYNNSDEVIAFGPLVTAIDANNLTVDFASASTGYVALMIPDYIHTQGGSSNTWNISHNLGTKYNHVTVYNSSNEIIIPDIVKVIDKNTMQITFSSAITGKAVISSGGSDVSGSFRLLNPLYTNSYIYNPNGNFTLTNKRCLLNQNITANDLILNLTVDDASDIPDQKGFLIFNFGKANQEGPVPYSGRPNNESLVINPLYTFTKNHLLGDIINYASSETAFVPRSNGSDFPAFITGTEEALKLVQNLIRRIKAVGVVLKFIVQRPEYRFLFW